MSHEEAIGAAALALHAGIAKGTAVDREAAHDDRDAILLDLLDVLAPAIADLARQWETTVGFWYS